MAKSNGELVGGGGSLIPVSIGSKSKYDMFKKSVLDKHVRISNKTTPAAEVEIKPGAGNFKYVKYPYMNKQALAEFGPYSFTGKHEIIYAMTPITMVVDGKEAIFSINIPIWISYDGVLEFIDEGLVRREAGVGAARVQYKAGKPRIPENMVDLDKNIKSARTMAKRDAMNRGMNIGDDIYQKRLGEELSAKTKREYTKWMKKADDSIRQRYIRFEASAGGIDNASEASVKTWITGIQRKIDIALSSEL